MFLHSHSANLLLKLYISNEPNRQSSAVCCRAVVRAVVNLIKAILW